jgi:hypothetical protein
MVPHDSQFSSGINAGRTDVVAEIEYTNHKKCYLLNFPQMPVLRVGKINGIMKDGKEEKFHSNTFESRVVEFPLKDKLQMFTDLVKDDPFVKPAIVNEKVDGSCIHPYYQFGKTFVNVNNFKDNPFDAVRLYLKGYENLPGLSGIKVSTLEQAAVGFSEATISNPINMQSSMGYGFSGAKSRFFEKVDGRIKIDPDVEKAVNVMTKQLEEGPIDVLALATLKDEPIQGSKLTTKSLRVFFVLSAIFNLVLKMYVESILNFIVQNGDFFFVALGVNASGLDCVKLLTIKVWYIEIY